MIMEMSLCLRLCHNNDAHDLRRRRKTHALESFAAHADTGVVFKEILFVDGGYIQGYE